MIRITGALTIALASFLALGSARADYFTYTDRTSFEAAIQGEKTETFNELSSSAQTYPGGLNQTTAPSLIQPIAITTGNADNNLILTQAFSSLYPSNGVIVVGPRTLVPTDGLVVNLPANQYSAAGADVATFGTTGPVSFFGTTSLGESFSGSVSVPSGSFGFLGVTTNSPTDYINSITFSAQLGANTNVTIDNVSFGTVPEPTSMALFMSGFLAAGVYAVRRRIRPSRA